VALLYYWRPDNYARDRRFGFGYHLNQNNPSLAAAARGDAVWAFTRRRSDGLYVLAADLRVRAVTRNPAGYRYGRHRVWADVATSRYFDPEAGPNAEPLIRALGLPANAAYLGQAFQGSAAVRSLTAAAAERLESFADVIPVLERVGFYAEDEFEARLVHDADVRALVLRGGADDARRRYLYETVDVQRARRHVVALQELYDGRCQVCLLDPRAEYGHALCEGHHIHWLSRGGEDALENMVLLCPTHHRAVHRDDTPFDHGRAAFLFGNGRVEALRVNSHLTAA
jgi:5-methylcytosine-specific restriction protein A